MDAPIRTDPPVEARKRVATARDYGNGSTVPRFLAKTVRAPSGCLIWMAAREYNGYGVFHPKRGMTTTAHRASHILFIGPIPEGFHVDHLCRNRRCVEPTHLQAVTPYENVVVRGTGRSAANAIKTRCIHGHPFDAENTYYDPKGGRACRACKAIHQATRGRRAS